MFCFDASDLGNQSECHNPMISQPLKRRKSNPNISLWEWAKQCNCSGKNSCNRDHAPVFTGLPQYTDWPVSEEFAKRMLTIHSKMSWAKPDDLKHNHNSFVEAFAEFLDSTSCSSAVHTIVYEARLRSEKRRSRDTAPVDLENQQNNVHTCTYAELYVYFRIIVGKYTYV